jgi:glycosyltransferase involved in cell wall biosynthesis
LLGRFDVSVVFFLHDWGFSREIVDRGDLVASPRGSDIVPPPGEIPPSPELVAKRVELLRRATSVGVSCDSFAGRVAEFAGLDAERIERLPLGVDLRLFAAGPGCQSTIQRPPCIGFFKGFREVYGAVYLVQAIPAVLTRFPDARFRLVGEGPQLETCQRLAVELGVQGSIHWMTGQPHCDMPKIMRDCDLTVLPSLCESFGVAALESQAMGIPVVACNVGGLKETVRNGETGILVPPACPEAIASAVIKLLENAEMRRRMGARGRAWVRGHYEWESVLTQWERVLGRTSNHAAPRPIRASIGRFIHRTRA